VILTSYLFNEVTTIKSTSTIFNAKYLEGVANLANNTKLLLLLASIYKF